MLINKQLTGCSLLQFEHLNQMIDSWERVTVAKRMELKRYGYQNTRPDEMMNLLVDEFLESAVLFDDQNAAGVGT